MKQKREIKKEIINAWSDNLVDLPVYSVNKLFKVCGPFLLGIELLKLPGVEEYRPLFVCFPLWKSDIKQCLDEPVFMQGIYNYKGLQFDIPYTEHVTLFQEALTCTTEQASILMCKSVSKDQLMIVIEKQFSEGIVIASPVGQLKLLEAQLLVALYLNDEDLFDKTFTRLGYLVSTYDKKYVEWKYGKVEDWLQSLYDLKVNRETFLKQIESNKQDKKIAKLYTVSLIP
ncbi:MULTISPECIES: hypothetical protein [unclassified Myroides]|uniref:hypothetical protein n=1 Tax=unclassified Myroides TaxID=2642485 RepID=UPI003D2F7684